MTEARIAFLCKAASMLSQANVNKTQEILKSYYMMRCKDLSKGYGLPQKYFSERVRCPHCCLEWKRESAIHIKPIKLGKRQRKRIKSQKKIITKLNKEHLLHSNELEQICAFCGHCTKTVIPKPNKPIVVKSQQIIKEIKATPNKIDTKQKKIKNKQTFNVFKNTVHVFNLNNKKNVLKSTVKEEPKIIKNDKKKKDKFAGLCQKAVLASAKLKQEKDKQNKLNLFLRPST